MTIREKWQKHFPEATFSYITSDYLSKKFKTRISKENLLINGALCPSEEIVEKLPAILLKVYP